VALPTLVKQVVDKYLGKYCAEKVPEEARDQVRCEYTIRGNTVTLLERRPAWRDPTEWVEIRVAQFRFEPRSSRWTLYFTDRNSRWRVYPESTPSSDFRLLLQAVDVDDLNVFWG